jgi:rhodanese-related sulfurtransferase
MKSIITKIALLIILSIGFISCAQSTKSESNTIETKGDIVVSLISPNDLNAKLGDIQLIDVRTPKEYAEGHLTNSVNINFHDATFADDMNKLDKDKELYIYCRSGGRSGKASKQLEKMGFTRVYDLQGGIISWNKNGLEIVK